MTGLVYQTMPMGAVPVGYKNIIELPGVHYQEVDMGESTGYRFISDDRHEYPSLSEEDIGILDEVIAAVGSMTKDIIVQKMHGEKAFTQTPMRGIIDYNLTKELSIL